MNQSVSELVCGMGHTNGGESFWSMPKCDYKRSDQKMSVKHPRCCVNELSGHHNSCLTDTLDQMELTMRRTIGRFLHYRGLASANGLYPSARATSA